MIQSPSSVIWNLPLLPYISITTSSILIILLLLLAIIYYISFINLANAPPRFPIFLSILRGKYDLVHKLPIKLIQDGYKTLEDMFRIQLLNQSVVFLIGT
jgi:hypothetical protein